MTEKDWRKLEKKWLAGKISEEKLLDITEKEYEHPDWWENPCYCQECKLCGY